MLASNPKVPKINDGNQYVHSLPPFANAANKVLSQKIKELDAKLTKLAATFEDSTVRTTAIKAHSKNVLQELNHTQALYEAKNRQIETEDHFKQVAEREAGRLSAEMKNMNAEHVNKMEYLNMLQTSIYRDNEKIEVIRAELKLENDELNEWLRVQGEKEDDNQTLGKYTKEDNIKIKDLSHSIENLMVEVNKRKANVNAEVTETQVAQIELEKTTEAFQQLHQERENIIHQWEEAVKAMQKRDCDIVVAQERYQQQLEQVRRTEGLISERERIHQDQLNMNKETEKSIAIGERQVDKHREDQTLALGNLDQYRNEIEVLKNTLSKSATDIVNKKSELNNSKVDLQTKQAKYESNRAKYEALKVTMKEAQCDTMTLEAKAEQLQELLKQEELRDKAIDKQMKVVRENQFKASQELFLLKKQAKNTENEITGGEASLKNLRTKVQRLDQDALKQRAMIYTMEFNIQQLERKLRRAEGDRTDEEKEILTKKINHATAALNEVTAKFTILNTQLKRSQEDLRHTKRKLETIIKSRDVLSTNIEELKIYNESATHQLKNKVKEREDVMVDESILRLELRKIRGFLNVRADEVFTLESRQLQLELALQERNKEIEIHKDILRIYIKNSDEERHSAAAELRDRVGKVEKLKKRYEILMTQFAPEDDDEEHSQAYYVIKAAQRREELQKEGDSLDANIRRAEKEIKALENTLKMMNDRNEGYRMNLYQAELDSTDVQHKEMLDTEYRRSMDAFKSKRLHMQGLQEDLETVEQTLQDASNQESTHTQSIRLVEAKIRSCEKDIVDQEVKVERAFKAVIRYAKLLRAATGTIQKAVPEESDFMFRNLRDIGTIVLTELNKLMIRFPDMVVPIKSLMSQLGVSPPSRVVSRASSRASFQGDPTSQPPSRAPSRAAAMAITKPPKPASDSISISTYSTSEIRASALSITQPLKDPSRIPSVTNINGT